MDLSSIVCRCIRSNLRTIPDSQSPAVCHLGQWAPAPNGEAIPWGVLCFFQTGSVGLLHSFPCPLSSGVNLEVDLSTCLSTDTDWINQRKQEWLSSYHLWPERHWLTTIGNAHTTVHRLIATRFEIDIIQEQKFHKCKCSISMMDTF